MLQIHEQHSIRILEYITPELYTSLNNLMELCCSHDRINLKLELSYKLHLYNLAEKNSVKSAGKKNEFLYYIGEELVSYLGISCFDGVTGELCGMTHPDYRNQGIFHRLLALASNECHHSDYRKFLLLADGNSKDGMRFLEHNAASYAHSEYRMKRLITATADKEQPSLQSDSDGLTEAEKAAVHVIIRPAEKKDEREIARQNTILFNDKEPGEEKDEQEISSLENQPENEMTYMVDLQGISIGKINVEYGDSYAFIFGFGILPEYRRLGYGRQALSETLRLIESQGTKVTELDVVCTNNKALSLYQSCGFEEQSVMNYYHLSI